MRDLDQLSGTHAGLGGCTVWARVYTAPAPFTPPAHLRERVREVLDLSGARRDWLPVSERDSATTAALRQWRSTYVLERAVGDLATVRSFLSWARRRSDVSALLEAGAGTPFPLESARATRALAQLQVAAALARMDQAPAFGLVRDEGSGLARSFVHDGADEVVLAGDGVALSLTTDGLVLAREEGAGTGLHVAGSGSRTEVLEWRQLGDGLHVRDGQGWRLLPDEQGAALLVALLPGAGHVRVVKAPVTSAYASLLTRLPEVLTHAASHAATTWLEL